MGKYILDESFNEADDGVAMEGFFDTLLQFCNGGIVVLLQAYFDESQRQNGLLCVAGYAFAPPQAKKLKKELDAIFGRFGGLHMNELVHRVGAYKGIRPDERDSLLKSAVHIISERFTYGVSVSVNENEFREKSPRSIRGFSEAYPFCCHMAMSSIVRLARKHDDARLIHYVFEAGHRDEAEARDFVGIPTKSADLRAFYQYSGHSFLPKSDATPLQAADLLAWETAKFKVETLDSNERAMRLSLAALWKAAPKRYGVSFCGGASLAKALQQYRELGIQQVQEESECKRQRDALRNTRTSTRQ